MGAVTAPEPESLDGALKLWLRAEYDAREGGLTPAALRTRLEALGPLTAAAARLGGFDGLAPGAPLLDAGTGSGLFLFGIAGRNPGLAGLGVDLSPGAIEGAARSAAALGFGRLRFEVADLEALPYPARSFAGAVCGCTLNLLPGKEAALRELARVLAPGAALVVVDSFVPARMAESGAEDPGAFLAKAARCGLAEAGREDVTALVRDLCARGAWPWSGAIREDATMLCISLRTSDGV